MAMHEAKQAGGRGVVHFYKADMQAVAEQRLQLEKDLRRALAESQFLLHYQPQVDGEGRLIGAEALVRWLHPQRGLVAPGAFIPAAEELGLIVPLGNWVLRAGGAQARQWCGEGDGPAPRLAINVSAQQFHQEDFIASCERTLSECGIAPRRLELEVTESLLLQDIDSAVRKMDRLREMGIRFSVDDFGTGYSSLAYLRRLPVDQLKIDRSFVTNVHRDERNAAIVRAIISLAGSLGLKTIAEGVEQEEEAAFLRAAGCDHFQGYLYGRPMPPEEFFRRWGWGGKRD
jgi:EAL domain-containing protein (putative c-di-GMP-specific phosphodiesterase class I)